jgi:PadR family transcriptional regulator PadR
VRLLFRTLFAVGSHHHECDPFGLSPFSIQFTLALGFTAVVEGTVYIILLRLEKTSWSWSKKSSTMGPPRKFFALNDAGRKELLKFWEKWEFVTSKINQLKEEPSND